MSLIIRTMTVADLEAADEIAVAAYGGPTRRQSELARYLALEPDGWMLALRDGTPVGLGGAVVYGPFAYIGLMAVHPSVQRQGIARAIMAHILRWLETQGCPVALLDASAMGRPLYASLGFVEDDKVVVFQRENAAAPVTPIMPTMPTTPVFPVRDEDLPDLVAFDTPIFGASRARVLASYLTDHRERAFLSRDAGGAINGYLVAQSQTLGPWVARTPEVAEALLAHALSLPFEVAPQMLVPAANGAAPALLARYGFGTQRALSHMHLGHSGSGAQRALVYGQTSFALG